MTEFCSFSLKEEMRTCVLAQIETEPMEELKDLTTLIFFLKRRNENLCVGPDLKCKQLKNVPLNIQALEENSNN